jgi:hypothetical protein
MFSELKIQTVDELVLLIQVIAWSFVVFVLMSVFGGTVGSMLWSVMFNQQPMKSMAPIDMAFTKMLNDVMLLMTGSVTTLIGMFAINKGARALAEKLAPTLVTPTPTAPISPVPQATFAPQASATTDFNWLNLKPVDFDEEWRAPPPPTTPPNYEHPEREEIAHERAAAKLESA